MSEAKTVVLREVGLRDGLQLASAWPTTAQKLRWIELERQAGIRHFEVGSFVPANSLPQFSDTAALVEALLERENLTIAVLAVNKRGALDGLASGAHDITCVVSASEEHSMRNARRPRDQALAEMREVADVRQQKCSRQTVSVAIAMAFGCSISGAVSPDEVVRLAVAAAEGGADAIGLADTIGCAGPRQVSALMESVARELPHLPISLHLHDTNGLGIANALAAIEAGASMIDASLGGIGGCPFAPGATGNIAMEDLTFLCRTLGRGDYIDLELLLEARKFAASTVRGEAMQGRLDSARLPILEAVHPVA